MNNNLYFLVLSLTLFTQVHAKTKPQQLIERLNITKNNVVVTANPSFHETYLAQDFFATYPQEVDLQAMDQSVVTISFLTVVAPIVWFSNKTYSIESMDEDLYHSFKVLKKVFQDFYPEHAWSGEIIPENLIKNRVNATTA